MRWEDRQEIRRKTLVAAVNTKPHQERETYQGSTTTIGGSGGIGLFPRRSPRPTTTQLKPDPDLPRRTGRPEENSVIFIRESFVSFVIIGVSCKIYFSVFVVFVGTHQPGPGLIPNARREERGQQKKDEGERGGS